jgi:CRISPR system Cascade subunit CasC
MSLPRFLQIHTLTSYPAVLLNRDDAGLAKRLSYGGSVRTRVSSQCLKRHWRTARGDDWSLDRTGLALSVRSRQVFEYAIAPRLAERVSGLAPEVVEAAGLAVSRAIYGEKADDPRKRQALLLGWREIEYLTDLLVPIVSAQPTAEEVARELASLFKDRDKKGNLTLIREAAGNMAAGLEAALFGRMVTSDPAANTDAAIHVAHAFTVHQQESETDYFTVVDDLRSADASADAGSAGIFDTELTTGLFYGYVVVDVPLLVSNLTGVAPEQWAETDADRTLPAKVVEHLVHLVATISPGAKKGSTAPYAWTQCMLLEAGSRQPRTLASAFEQAVRATPAQSLSKAAESALFGRLAAFDRVYGARESRAFLSLDDAARTEAVGPLGLDELAHWASTCVASAEAKAPVVTPLQPQV